MANRIACVDADSLLYKSCAEKIKYDEFGKPILDDFGNKIKIEMTFQESKDIFDDLINNILNKTEATHYIVALTTGKCHRYEIYPEYKANRKDKEKPKHFHTLKDYCISKYKAIFHNDLEADDICLIYSKNFTNKNDYAYLCSLDKDLLNLEGTHFNYDKNEWITVNKNEADYFFTTDLLVGQSGDNIKCVEGIGKVGAEKILKSVDLEDSLMLVFGAYLKKYGWENGVKEFWKNYQVLKIKDNWPNFKIEEPIKYERFNTINLNDIC